MENATTVRTSALQNKSTVTAALTSCDINNKFHLQYTAWLTYTSYDAHSQYAQVGS